MKDKLNELYIRRKNNELYVRREKIIYEIERLKKIQQSCDHIFSPTVNNPELRDGNLIKRCYKWCVICGKVESSYSFYDSQHENEYSFKMKL